MDYGKKQKSIRENKKISIYRISQETGISQGHISDLENGRNQPTIETLRKILVPLGITLAEFFNENKDVSYLNERETKLLAQFRNMPDDKAELFLQLGKALSEHCKRKLTNFRQLFYTYIFMQLFNSTFEYNSRKFSGLIISTFPLKANSHAKNG